MAEDAQCSAPAGYAAQRCDCFLPDVNAVVTRPGGESEDTA